MATSPRTISLTRPGQVRSLGGTWRFRTDPDDQGRDEHFYGATATDRGWKTIRVPAHWQTQRGWEDYNGWAWYRRPFAFQQRSVPESHRVWLCFHGVSYWADVWLNGEHVGAHEGHFGAFEIDVTDHLRARNVLVVRCGCPLEPWQTQTERCGGKDKRTTLGALQDWDCLPYPCRTNPSGIWRDVELRLSGPVRLRHFHLETVRLDQPQTDGPARVAAVLGLLNTGARYGSARLRLVFTPRNFRKPSQVVDLTDIDILDPLAMPVAPSDGLQTRRIELDLDGVRAWWPWDMGKPNLYDVDAQLYLGDKASDVVATGFGFRTVDKGLADPAADRWDWALRINGVRFFARGANYLSDQLPSRMTPARFRRDLKLAVDAHMNMLRPFANVEPPEFFDACDEMGLMVYQDFPMQWGGYATDGDFVRSCVRQAGEMVHLVKNHPCVFMYAGHSEPWKVEVREQLAVPMADAVRRLDPTRPVIVENGTGPEHDLHAWGQGWYGGHIGDVDRWCADAPAGMVGEFGAQSFPCLESLAKYPSLKKADLDNPLPLAKFVALNMQPEKFHQYMGLRAGIDPIETWIEVSQTYQAELLKAHIEAFRRHKYHPINGAMVFHLTDNHPGINWSIVDVRRVPKPAYHAVARAFRPVHVMAAVTDADADPVDFRRAVFVVNDSLNTYADVAVHWSLSGPGGADLSAGQLTATIPADSVVEVGLIDVSLSDRLALGAYHLRLSLCAAEGAELSDNDYTFRVALLPGPTRVF